MIDLFPYRERMIEAILSSHAKRALERFPPGAYTLEQVRKETDTYLPYAASDVDAIILALKSS